MCPVFRNDNDHRAFPFGRPDLALPPHGVREFKGEDADAVNGTSGVVLLDGKEGEDALQEYRESQADPALSDESPSASMGGAVSLAREITNATVTGPLNRVIGDDQAPHGPGSGTITTKQAVQENDPAHFGPGEATAIGPVAPQVPAPGRDAPTSAEVHNDQLEAGKRAGAISEQLLGSALAPAGDGEGDEGGAGDGEDEAFDPEATLGDDVTAEQLEEVRSAEDLKTMSAARDLPVSGNKHELATAIVEHDKNARESA